MMLKSESKACELLFTCRFQQKKCPIALLAESSVTTNPFSELHYAYICTSPYLLQSQERSTETLTTTTETEKPLEIDIAIPKKQLELWLVLLKQHHNIQIIKEIREYLK